MDQYLIKPTSTSWPALLLSPSCLVQTEYSQEQQQRAPQWPDPRPPLMISLPCSRQLVLLLVSFSWILQLVRWLLWNCNVGFLLAAHTFLPHVNTLKRGSNQLLNWIELKKLLRICNYIHDILWHLFTASNRLFGKWWGIDERRRESYLGVKINQPGLGGVIWWSCISAEIGTTTAPSCGLWAQSAALNQHCCEQPCRVWTQNRLDCWNQIL